MAKRKDPAAVALGRKGGTATAKKRTKIERFESAKKAADQRWADRSEEERREHAMMMVRAREKKARRKPK